MEKSVLFSITLALASILCAVSYASPAFSYIHRMTMGSPPTTGYAENCGTTPFNISWTPDVLNPRGSVKITVKDYVAPYYFDGGFVNATVSFYGDKEPFIGYAGDFGCDKISTYIKCPMEKGHSVNEFGTIRNLHALSAYPGDYEGRVVVYNKQHKEMICIKLHLKISGN